ncbi:MAG: DNA polymerase III subunit epsilon [Alphaproteobacteria bacterium]|nr:DNA polymerase III subunit epsilon [Alphaproteobacteria bacterium]
MREVVFDTETTGTRVDLGHRIVELGAVEIVDNAVGETLQFYFNPERAVDVGAYEVHGLSDEFLAKQVTFSEKLADILEFFGDSPLIAHNADFDRMFLNCELQLADYPPLPPSRFIDTLKMSRQRYKSSRHSLDALCERLDVDNGGRVLHGALRDSILLARVYVKMTAGEQHTMQFEQRPMAAAQVQQRIEKQQQNNRSKPFVARRVAALTTEADTLAAHRNFVAEEIINPLWLC